MFSTINMRICSYGCHQHSLSAALLAAAPFHRTSTTLNYHAIVTSIFVVLFVLIINIHSFRMSTQPLCCAARARAVSPFSVHICVIISWRSNSPIETEYFPELSIVTHCSIWLLLPYWDHLPVVMYCLRICFWCLLATASASRRSSLEQQASSSHPPPHPQPHPPHPLLTHPWWVQLLQALYFFM